MTRYISIDLMRAMAIIFMVLCHAVIYLSAPESGPWIHFLGNHVVGDFAAPFFAFLLGVSQAVSLARKSFTMSKKRIVKDSLARGGLVVAVGLLFGVLAWGIHGLWAWDILPLLGVSLIILALMKDRSMKTILLVSILLLVIAPYGRQLGDYQSSWGGKHADVLGISSLLPDFIADPVEEYEPQLTIADRVEGFFFEGEFPLFPWLCFPLIGFLVGRVMGRHRGRLSILGCFLTMAGFLSAYLSSLTPGHEINDVLLTPLSFYPDTTAMIFVQLGLCLVAFSGLQHFDSNQEVSSKYKKIFSWSSLFSKYSLTIYIVHHFILLWPLWIMGYMQGDREMYYANAATAGFGLFAGTILLIVLYKIIQFWDTKSGKYSFEWLLQKTAP